MSSPTKAELTAIAIRDAHTDVAKNTRWLTTRIYVADLKMLLDKIADLCPTHGWCEHCEAPVCETCGLGTFADCDCPCLHCRSDECLARCVADNHLDDDRHTPASWVSAR
jgi:hypothetical protein